MLTRVSRFGSALPRLLSKPPARFVSQSNRTSAAGSAAVTELHPAAEQAGHGEVSPYVKNPDYHGFSSDPVVDRWNMRVAFFFSISVVLVIGGTFIHYLPDHGMRQWARREAERVIQQREKAGLPVIGENYYDPNKIILAPAGEE
ncbi:NADH dehydrogenase [ubiquinone] 1 beta subcomplex subunit 11, mitochondrial [Etheostoma cragini]|uniref:NADH dehydrogenase [ubiquinone] 1 beta subcomplex subunit 11, mitochondrial n=1 Tax=Etheostoma cragini TaxID=417921 RepID=UPI00155E5B01|nr:NADH dehydrogenase [ubiquinone] 1 beta subcomplex subunit 11, mitochondrial [Etheostoma cragini]